MKKTLLLMIMILVVLTAAGCGDMRGQTVAEAPSAVPGMPEESQKELLMAHYEDWAFQDSYDPWFYTFTDLDHNGRLEVLAASTQGSGVFTWANCYEIAADYAGLDDCLKNARDGDNWPEFILDSWPCYYDASTGRYYYVCEGITKDGYARTYYDWNAISLVDGILTDELLAWKSVDYSSPDQEAPVITCRAPGSGDQLGDEISEQEYNGAAEKRFAGMEQSILPLSWVQVDPSSMERTDDTEKEADAADESGFLSAYSGIIAAYRAAYESGKSADPEYLQNQGISEMTAYSSGVGYMLKDLDENGIPELIIAGMGTDDFSGGMAYEIDTLADGWPVNVALSRARNRYYLCADGTILNEGSSGAGFSCISLYRLSGRTLQPVEGIMTFFPGDERDGCYHQTGAFSFEPQPGDEKMDEAAFQTMMEDYESRILTPALTKIA